MGRRYSLIQKGKEYETALKNYKDYIEEKLTNPTSKALVGGTVGAGEPRKKVAVKTFGRDSNGVSFNALQTISGSSWDKLNGALPSRVSGATADLVAASKLSRFKAARVHYFEPSSASGGTATYKQSTKTKLYYVHRTGKSYSSPFGALTDTEEELEGSVLVQQAIYNIAPATEYRRVWISNEKFSV